jgi:multidrug efflux pump subunit AcrA (membrane-fusion protein)
MKGFMAAAIGSAWAMLAGGLDGALAQKAQTPQPDALPAAQVTVVRAKNACFSEAVHVTGFLVARSEAVVTLDVPGYQVTEVLVGEGDEVRASQDLVKLARDEGGEPQGAPRGPATMTLKAPAGGVVLQSSAVVGAAASAMLREPLFTIAVDNEIELEAEVPSIHLPNLSPGQRARIQIGERELTGRVRRVPSAVNRATQLGRARIALDGGAGLRIGMFAQAIIDADRSCGVSVPRSSVTYQTGGTSVQIVRDNVIETRRVQVGFHSDTDTEIRSGLKEGDLVVANAGSSLRNGDRVNPIVIDGLRSDIR